MQALYLSPRMCWPTLSGAPLRDFYLARQIARHFTLTFVGLDREMYGPVGSCRVERLEPLHNSDVYHVKRHPGYRRSDLLRGVLGPTPISVLNFTAPEIMVQVEHVIRERKFDAIQVEGVHLLEYAKRIRKLAPDAPLLCDWHNIESEIQARYAETSGNPARRIYARRTASLLRAAERELLQLGDAHTVCSDRERQVLLAEVPGARIEVIPNGVDTDFFAGDFATDQPRQNLVFVGSMDYHANIDAVQFFAKETWPEILRRRPDLQFVIVGSRPVAAVVELGKLPGITVTGTVDDVRPYYRNAVAVVVPLRVGSGTRLKVLEAMAAGVPVISTTVGAEGLDVTHGKDILIADSPVEIAEAAASLRYGSGLWKDLTANALLLVQRHYDWSAIGEKLVTIHADLMASGRAASALAVSGHASQN
jgi:sugar transferase (PEP-CTERM/EpsH1 system associated)